MFRRGFFNNSGNAYGASDPLEFNSPSHADQGNGASQNPGALDLNPLGAERFGSRSLGNVEADSPFSLGFGNSGQNSNGYAGLGPSNPNLSIHGGAAKLATARDNTVTSSRVYSHDSSYAGMPKRGDSFFEHHETPEDLQKLCPNAVVADYKHPAYLASTGSNFFGSSDDVEPKDPDQQAQGCESLDHQIRHAMGINTPFGLGSQDPSSGW